MENSFKENLKIAQEYRLTFSVADVTLKLESAVAPFEFQSHVSKPTNY